MRVLALIAMVAGLGLAATPAHAQDYRARVQGRIVDTSQAALPGVTVKLTNVATGVAVDRVSDAEGRYLFDFVEPGTYTVTAELQGFKKTELANVRVQQRGDVTADITMSIGLIEESVTVEPTAATGVRFNSATTELNVDRQLIDQAPIGGRNPYNLAALDPTVLVSPATNENRPYHHAYANDYDAGGGTRRANDVLLDGVPLGASYKTSYTPAVDAVEEITISKNSVDAENGNSLGGIISLNMKSGTNNYHGSGYAYFRDPGLNARTDPTLADRPGRDAAAREHAADAGRDARRSDPPQQDLLLHVLRAVERRPSALDRAHGPDRARAPRRLQPVAAERPGAHHLQPEHLHARCRRAWSSGSRSPAT